MSWRTVVISSRCKLDFKMGFMVVRGESTQRVFLDEISVLLIENPAVSFTGCLLQALVAKKIKVIFCDNKHLPMAELVPYYNSYDCSKKVKSQIAWSAETKGDVWTEIVKEKIKKQAGFLLDLGKTTERDMLLSYISQIGFNDSTNREGHAAKVYFNALFGMDFSRNDCNTTNAALNYGYSIILSVFSREIVASGYLTQLGIFHDNIFNPFNLACDLMEPFRILVDRKIKSLTLNIFESEQKRDIADLLNDSVIINYTRQTVLNAIKIYCHSVFDALECGNPAVISHYELSNFEK
ncbi:MAG: type II CRISPR-associated endonuclease Cas1 [Spirochaetaceae bacterium]|nr:type II CRISPR-associated endonuclease Cas1 [Spirochaetaceae bacterium]